MQRSSGILMPMSSLPSNFGIGTMGKCAYEFVDFLSDAGQKFWQFLPLGSTSCGDSPYSSFSAFAGNPYYIDLDMLIEDGLLLPEEVLDVNWGNDAARTDYDRIHENRFQVLRFAYGRGRDRLAPEIAAFRRENSGWIENYALYTALKAEFGMASWTEWPDEDIRLHHDKAVSEYSARLAEEIGFYVFMQFLFFSQWTRLRAYAQERGVKFIGDIPIYVALDSADVWSEPQFFQLDEDSKPLEVAGVPPDAFTDEGQLWGNPLYDWQTIAADGFGWWIRRIDGARKLYDVLRIDHFRGLESYWAVPSGDKTAANGVWKPGPGMKLVGVLTAWFKDMQFIAEDLGYPTEGLRALLEASGLPGMKVLEFAFDAHSESDYLPHRCERRSVCYIGTHDNDTVRGWLETINEEDRDFARRYMHITEDEGWCWGLIRTGMATASDLFVMQMQDVLELPTDCRMNTPGVALGNWRWRMLPDALGGGLAAKLLQYTKLYRRI